MEINTILLIRQQTIVHITQFESHCAQKLCRLLTLMSICRTLTSDIKYMTDKLYVDFVEFHKQKDIPSPPAHIEGRAGRLLVTKSNGVKWDEAAPASAV